MGAVVRYAKTRPVFDGYKAPKYSRKYLAEHEAELADYRAAKARRKCGGPWRSKANIEPSAGRHGRPAQKEQER